MRNIEKIVKILYFRTIIILFLYIKINIESITIQFF